MASPKDWTIPQDLGSWMRQQEKRTMHEERRPRISKASDIMGPGIAPRAVVITDWNSEIARAFNGFYYAGVGSAHSPDEDKAWMGITVSTGDHIQQVIWSHGDTPVEGFVRTGHQHNATVSFGSWEPIGGDVPDAALYLNDLLDVTLAGVANGEILMFDTPSGQWKNHTFAHTHTSSDVSTATIATNPVPRVVLGPGAAIVTWDSKESEVYDIYVAESNSSAPTTTDKHPDFVGVRPPAWVRKTPGGIAMTTSGTYYFAVRARNAGGSGPALTAADWVEGRPGTVDPQYLVLNADIIGVNEMFAEVLQAVDVDVSGDFTANTLTAVGKATFRAPDNELAKAANLTLQKGTTAPTSPIGVVQDWETLTLASGTTLYGGLINGGFWYAPDAALFSNKVYKVNITTGAATLESDVTGKHLTRIGTNWWKIGTGTTPTLYRYDSSWGSQTTIGPLGTIYGGAMGLGTDGTNLYVFFVNASNKLCWNIYNTSGVQQGSTVVSVAGATPGSTFIPLGMATISSVLRIMYNYSSTQTFYLLNASDGARDTSREWPLPPSAFSWYSFFDDGSNIRGYSPTTGLIYKFTNDTWASSTFDNRTVAATWNDATHETDLGTTYTYAAKKRARTTLTLSAPTPAGATGYRLYMARVASPVSTDFWRVGDSTVVPTVLTNTPTFASPNVNPPASNQFTDNTPARIRSWDSTYYIDANFDALLKSLTLSAAGLTALQAAILRPELFVKLNRNASQALADSTDTPIAWDVEVSDVSAMHVAGATGITIPAGADGRYDIQLSATFQTNTTGRRSIWINKNSSAAPSVNVIEQTRNGNPTSGAGLTLGGFWAGIPLVAGDIVRGWGFQNSTASLNITEAYMTLRWIGP